MPVEESIAALMGSMKSIMDRTPEEAFADTYDIMVDALKEHYADSIRKYNFDKYDEWTKEQGPNSKKMALLSGEQDAFEEAVEAAVVEGLEKLKGRIHEEATGFAESAAEKQRKCIENPWEWAVGRSVLPVLLPSGDTD